MKKEGEGGGGGEEQEEEEKDWFMCNRFIMGK